MKIQLLKLNPNQRGSVLVLALVLAGLGTIGVAAWATLLGARSAEAEQNQTALDRRIRFSNSLALGRQALYQNYMHANGGPATVEEYALDGDWGRATINRFTEAPLAFSGATRTNKTGAVPFRAFSLDVEVGVDDGSTLHEYLYHLKSYSPVLGGDLVYVHKNSESGDELIEVSGNLEIEGRAQFWNGDFKTGNMTMRSNAALIAGDSLPNLAFQDPDDNAILPSNFPFTTQLSGTVGGVANLDGRMNIVANPDTASNSYFDKVQSYDSTKYENVDGGGVGGQGAGLATIPDSGNPDQASEQATIDGGGYTAANLAPHAPLSSSTLRQVIADPSLSSSEKQQIIADNQPIPDDVIADVINEPSITAAQEQTILEQADYTYKVESGVVVVNLNSSSLPHLLITNAEKIELHGQPDDASAALLENEEPRVIAIKNDSGVELRNITCFDQNKRRIILAFHNNGTASNHVVDVAFSGASAFPEWHLVMDFEGLRTRWDTSAIGGLRLFGGIRTDQLFDAESGDITIFPEPNTDVLDTMVSRVGWIEVTPK